MLYNKNQIFYYIENIILLKTIIFLYNKLVIYKII